MASGAVFIDLLFVFGYTFRSPDYDLTESCALTALATQHIFIMNKYLTRIKTHQILQIIFFVLLIAIDQITKIIAAGSLKENGPVTVISGFADFQYLENTGAAFGILENAMWFFYIITIIIFLVIAAVWYRFGSALRRYAFSCEDPDTFRQKTFSNGIFLGYILAALAAGAIGNFVDRIINGYVIDFIRFTFFNFPIFNFADICVTISVILLCVFFIFIYKEDPAFKPFGKNNRK